MRDFDYETKYFEYCLASKLRRLKIATNRECYQRIMAEIPSVESITGTRSA